MHPCEGEECEKCYTKLFVSLAAYKYIQYGETAGTPVTV